MILPFIEETAVWYGPATVTFPVQFAGDPFDPVRNDVRVKFIGDKSQREERLAYFDSRLGVWRAVLYTKSPGSYRAILVRNGQESDVEPVEGIVDLKRSDVGILPAQAPRDRRWTLDTGDDWVGIGAVLSASGTARDVNALADAGANWISLTFPGTEPSVEWEGVMEAVERRGFYFTLQLPDNASAAWRRYALARYGASPKLVQWDTKAKLDDPWKRGPSSALPWGSLLENRPGPFVAPAGDYALVRALKAMVDSSEWARWHTPQAWKNAGAEGVTDGDWTMILKGALSSKVEGVPLRDGTYDLTAIDWATGRSSFETAQVVRGTVAFKVSDRAFYVLRRRT